MAERHRDSYDADVDDVHADNDDPRLENKEQRFCHRSSHLKFGPALDRQFSCRTTVNSLAGGESTSSEILTATATATATAMTIDKTRVHPPAKRTFSSLRPKPTATKLSPVHQPVPSWEAQRR
ncbi:uncharacterized protein FFB14_12374 [Fusarium fujikuroi]|nr:uncharacterized protein FFB14_12374 [Fusarium fujikuroi]